MTDVTVSVPAVPATPSLNVVDLVNLVAGTVKAVEAAYPAGAKGADKFAAAVAIIDEFTPLFTVGAEVVQKLLPYLINTAVALFNAAGLFVKSVEAAIHPVAPAVAAA